MFFLWSNYTTSEFRGNIKDVIGKGQGFGGVPRLQKKESKERRGRRGFFRVFEK
tara:strand:- start:169 stop:330 length:162 start_codon:yes stop_codon:yes gene_type:complete